MAKRRGNNEGNIRQRTDHSWEASLQFEDKRHYVYGQTKKEVKRGLGDEEIMLQTACDDSDGFADCSRLLRMQ